MTAINNLSWSPMEIIPSSVNRHLQTGRISQWKRDLDFLNDPYVPTREKRKIKVNIAYNIFKRTVSYSVAGGLVGGGVGAVVGGVVSGPPGIVPGVALGVAIGCSVGAKYGFVVGIAQTPKVIEVNYHYKRWRSEAIEKEIYSKFRNQLQKEDLFRDLICPISLSLPEIPLITNCGHTFDQETIEHWIDRGGRNARCPSCRAKISHGSSRINELFLKKIVARCAMYQQIEKAGLGHEIGRIDSQDDAFFRMEIQRLYEQALELNNKVTSVKLEAIVKSAVENPEVTEEDITRETIKIIREGRIDQKSKDLISS